MSKSISGYDIIGDIHGHAEELIAILHKMDYQLKDHVWVHPERKAIFVGDYIDRGPAIRETLYIVKRMVDEGSAFAIMGNHEFNALAFAYRRPDGGYIREHSIKNLAQHDETIKQFQGYEGEWGDHLTWFTKLPLFLEIDGLRIVHACWDDERIAFLKTLQGPITRELLLRACNTSDKAWGAFEETLKGKEIKLHDGHYFIDKDGNKRTECRNKWWLNPEGLTLDEYLFHAPVTAKHIKVPPEYKSGGYDPKAPSVFFGHYWLNDEKPNWQAPNVCCLDYSVAKKGMLVAYRHYFDQTDSGERFITVGSIN